MEILTLAARAVLGGLLVVAFAAFAQTLKPKRFAGVFAAAPTVALASLGVTLVSRGPADARSASAGMVAGAVGFVLYCLVAPAAIRRFGAVRGSASALVAWVVGAVAVLPVSGVWGAAGIATAGTRPDAGGPPRPPLQLDAGQLREGSAKDWFVRFLFGAGTSMLAGGVSLLAGPVVGGTFLAFPAILLASLTLVAKEDGTARSRDDARGATFGALGLVVFGAVGAAAFSHLGAVAVLALESGAWAVVAIGTYLLAWAVGAGADEPA